MTVVRVFVNERPVDVAAGATVADAVTAFDHTLGARLAAGEARTTDARGIDIAPTEPIGPGSILRVLTSCRPAALSSCRPSMEERHAGSHAPRCHAG